MEANLNSWLAGIRRRVLWLRITRNVGWSSLVGFLAGAAFLGLAKWHNLPGTMAPVAGVLWAVGVLTGILIALRRLPGAYETAKWVDDRMGLADRLSSAHAFVTQGVTTPFAELAISDAESEANRIRPAGIVPRPRWVLFAAGVVLSPVLLSRLNSALFPPPPPPVIETVSQAELGAALNSIETAMEDPQTFQQLQAELQKLGIGETTAKGELLARINRTIAELRDRAGEDEGVLTTLQQMEKLKAKIGLTELQQRADEELQNVEQLVTDTGVQAEAIRADRLVTPQQTARLAEGLKEVANRQLGKAPSGESQAAETEDLLGASPAGETPEAAETPGGEGPEGTPGGKPAPKKIRAEDLGALAVTDAQVRERILTAARQNDRSSSNYRVVYHNYRRAFLEELFRLNIGTGRREILERYFQAIRAQPTPPAGKP